ncbi:sodium/calcium exchanger protein domain-containing protein [Rhizoctonia solani AG-1 IA]|uniref:Sodium/calcium exchanger protein domain-containing protein n=1 Tax=Thanatephorus cucumeris (strain AG1-IA) TaxID=983506 RepID=L8WTD8_THACA|nr:sodium/calcium exchanger protein domain-containing protein [Rhizoctonia solani AG-1 IA]
MRTRGAARARSQGCTVTLIHVTNESASTAVELISFCIYTPFCITYTRTPPGKRCLIVSPFAQVMVSRSLPLLSSRESDGSFFLSLERAIGYIIVGGEPGWAESTRFILLSTRFNAFLVCVPLAIISKKLEWDADLRFAFNEATGPISMRLNYTLGCLLSSSLGNAVEIIVGLAALLHGKILLDRRCKRLSFPHILGSILSNSVLVLGMSFLADAVMQRRVSKYTGKILHPPLLINDTAHDFGKHRLKHPSTPPIPNGTSAPTKTEVIDGSRYDGLLPLSHSAALILLALYIVYLFFQLRTHSDLFRPHYDDESVAEVEPSMSAISSAAWSVSLAGHDWANYTVLVKLIFHFDTGYLASPPPLISRQIGWIH